MLNGSIQDWRQREKGNIGIDKPIPVKREIMVIKINNSTTYKQQ